MKKIIYKTCAFIISFAMTFSIFSTCVYADEDDKSIISNDDTIGTTYYVDSENGSDNNIGNTIQEPWKTLNKVNEQTFLEGGQILFRAGTEYTGSLAPKGNGTSKNPIIIDMYDEDIVGIEAGQRPVLNGQGNVLATVHLKNVSHFTVNNLEITNLGNARAIRAGVFVEANNIGIMNGIHLDNLYVHDVNGTLTNKDVSNGGIFFTVTGHSNKTRFNDILVENCSVKNVSRTGISVGMTTSASKWDGHGGYIPKDVVDDYGHTNIVIRNNYVENAGGDAIVPMFSIKPLIEYNISNGASQNTKSNPWAMYNAGVWPWRCEDATFQFNEVYNTVNNGDGQAFDCDYSRGTTYQYNYSHDNGGGFLLICQSESLESTIRYNISQNDKRCIFLTSNSHNADIYNNTVYIGEGLNTNIVEDCGGRATLKNNIFYNAGSRKNPSWGRNYSYDNNLYYGFNTTPTDNNKILSDPLFVDGGNGETGVEGNSAIDTLAGYSLQDNSPAVNVGVEITSNGGRDYLGNSLGNTTTDLGAIESNVKEVRLNSDIYIINNKQNTVTLSSEIDYLEFLSNVTYSQGASIAIKNDSGQEINSGLIKADYKIIINDGEYNKIYTVKVYIEPTLSTDKTEYKLDEKIKVSYTGAEGDSWVGIYHKGDVPGNIASIDWKYTKDQLQPDGMIEFNPNNPINTNESWGDIGEYEVILFKDSGYNIIKRIPFSIDNMFSTDKTEYLLSEKIKVSYSGAKGDSWVGIYHKGDVPGDIASIDWKYTKDQSQPNGMIEFNPNSPITTSEPWGNCDEYEAILFKDEGYTIVKRTSFKIKDSNIVPNKPIGVTYNRTATKLGYADGTITISPADDETSLTGYELYWGDENGKLEEYTPIVTLLKTGNEITYNVVENTIIPLNAKKILAYSINSNTHSTEYAQTDLDINDIMPNEEPIYKFQVMSDVHIRSTDSNDLYNRHFDSALKDIKSVASDSIGIFIVGDNTNSGASSEYDKMNNIIQSNENGLPTINFAIGNHDLSNGSWQSKINLFLQKTGMESYKYSKTINNSKFIVLGSQATGLEANIKKDQFDWLEEELASAPIGQPIFLFLHQSLYNTVAGSLSGQGWNGVIQDDELRQILSRYPQTILFTGHSHWEFDSKSNMFDGKGQLATMFNTSSCAYLWTDEQTSKEGSQGYYVEVYSDKILVKGRDYVNNKWVSSAQFIVNN